VSGINFTPYVIIYQDAYFSAENTLWYIYTSTFCSDKFKCDSGI